MDPNEEKTPPFWINPNDFGDQPDDAGSDQVDTGTLNACLDDIFEYLPRAISQLKELHIHAKNHFHHQDVGTLPTNDFFLVPDENYTITDDSLVHLFHSLQRFAVTLEHVLRLSEDTLLSANQECEETYNSLLTACKSNMVQLLCQLQIAILQFRLEFQADVTRNMLPPELKPKPDSRSKRALRDILFIQEYHRCCEFVIKNRSEFYQFVT